MSHRTHKGSDVLSHVGAVSIRPPNQGHSETMRKDSPRAHNCRAHEPDVSDSNHDQHTTSDDTTQNTHPHPTTRTKDSTSPPNPPKQFPAKTPKHHTTARYDEIIVADDDAILFELESTPGDPDA
ncbi:hypothetical protein JCM18750_38190 [Halostagnicola bangensis]